MEPGQCVLVAPRLRQGAAGAVQAAGPLPLGAGQTPAEGQGVLEGGQSILISACGSQHVADPVQADDLPVLGASQAVAVQSLLVDGQGPPPSGQGLLVAPYTAQHVAGSVQAAGLLLLAAGHVAVEAQGLLVSGPSLLVAPRLAHCETGGAQGVGPPTPDAEPRSRSDSGSQSGPGARPPGRYRRHGRHRVRGGHGARGRHRARGGHGNQGAAKRPSLLTTPHRMQDSTNTVQAPGLPLHGTLHLPKQTQRPPVSRQRLLTPPRAIEGGGSIALLFCALAHRVLLIRQSHPLFAVGTCI